jgi:hypothetical protein
MFLKQTIVFACGLLFLLKLNGQEWQWSVEVKGGKSNPDARAFLWISPLCKKVKAVIVAENNMEEQSILENKKFRKAMSDLGFAEIWVSPMFDNTFRFTEGAGEVFNKMMNDLADSSGYTELKYAPIIGIGHSAAASWPYYFAAWNPERTLACISVSGQWPYVRNPQFSPDIWSKEQNIDFIPSLETMGEYEAAATWSTEGLKERKEHPFMPLSMLACPAEGHFAATQKKIDYITLYIKKAAHYRLPYYDPSKGPPKLKPVNPAKTGWLMDKWRYNQRPVAQPAPIGKYKGDTAQAFWFFDEEMVRATEKYESVYKNRKAPLLGYVQERKIVQQRNTHLQVDLKFLPQRDGITFILKGGFLDTVPGESPRPSTWTSLSVGAKIGHPKNEKAISIDRIAGPFKKINDTTFQLSLEKGLAKEPRNYVLTFAVTHPGDNEYKPAVQQAQMIIPIRNIEGLEQHISFPAITNQKTNTLFIKLQAHSNANLPVYYYVLEGPAEIKEDKLYITKLPPRAKFPVKLTVVAWQYGKSSESKIQTAQPVQQSFYIVK